MKYFHQRWYDPATRRFISKDPTPPSEFDPLSFNPYVPFNLNPVRYEDPTGEFADILIDAVSVFFSTKEFVQNPTITNAIGLSVDLVAAVIPGVPGGVGLARHAAKEAGEKTLLTNTTKRLTANEVVGEGASRAMTREAAQTGVERGVRSNVDQAVDVPRAPPSRSSVAAPIAASKVGDDVASATVNANTRAAAARGSDKFSGVRQLSETLRTANVSRKDRLNIIRSFKEGTIRSRTATGNENVLRFFGGGKAKELGRFVTPNFPAFGSARDALALPPENLATGLTQFNLKPSALFFEGTVAPNFGRSGGGLQFFVPNIEDLLRLP